MTRKNELLPDLENAECLIKIALSLFVDVFMVRSEKSNKIYRFGPVQSKIPHTFVRGKFYRKNLILQLGVSGLMFAHNVSVT